MLHKLLTISYAALTIGFALMFVTDIGARSTGWLIVEAILGFFWGINLYKELTYKKESK